MVNRKTKGMSKEMTIEEAVEELSGDKGSLHSFMGFAKKQSETSEYYVTPKEYEALKVLIQHAKEVKSKQEIEGRIHYLSGIQSENIDTYDERNILNWTLKKD